MELHQQVEEGGALGAIAASQSGVTSNRNWHDSQREHYRKCASECSLQMPLMMW